MVITNFFEKTLVAGIIGDLHFLKAEIIFEKPMDVSRIKSSIAKEGIRMEGGVAGRKVRKNGI